MATRHDYRRQAQTYDRTRAASPSIMRVLRAAIADAPGPELLDVGGGTGNYAVVLRDEGFAPVVVDVSPAMLARAAAKGLRTARGDAADLPFPDAGADAVILVSMLHHVPDWRAALREAARVLRPGGRLAVVAFTRENVDRVGWVADYFPSTRAWMLEQHPRGEELLAVLPQARLVALAFEDVVDGSLAALQHRPHLLLDPAVRRQTSYFERLAEARPDELEAGLARLRADLAAGRDPNRPRAAARARHGDAVLVAWAKPAPAGPRPRR
jgi:ubiquinone/menaquinone biosynthesis C-methylase UbiE